MSDNEATSAGAAPPPLHGLALVTAGILIALANVIVILDLTIANVSIPTIAAGLGVSPREGAWVITSYAVAKAITVPLTGWLARRFGAGRAFVFAVTSFGINSALCGLSSSLGMLVFFRVLQGLSGGPLIPLSQTLLLSIFPKEKSSTAMAVWSMTTLIGPTAGPILGGQICDRWSWPWIFLINVPIAIIVAYFCARLLRGRDETVKNRTVDVVGLGLMALWIGCLQIMLDKGQELDWFDSPLIVVLSLVAAISFVAFLIWELTEHHPIVNLWLFRNRSFGATLAALCLGNGAFFGSIVLQPLWLQTNMGYTPVWAGYAAAPTSMTVFCMTPLISWLTRKTDLRLLISVGMLGLTGVNLWRAHFASNVSFEIIIYAQVLMGFCVSFFFQPSFALALSSVKPEELASAAGLLAFTRSMAIAFSTSLTITAWQNAATSNRVGILDNFHGNVLAQFHNALPAPDQLLSQLDNMVQQQAVMLATNDIYLALALATALGSICIWLTPRLRASRRPTGH